MSWKTISTQILVEDYHVTVKKNKVELPGGTVINDFYTVTIPDSVMVAAVTLERQIILKSEFRYACGIDVIECPAGMMEKGEEPLTAAKRELLEETGYTSEDWTYLGPTLESTSKLTNTMHLFLARNAVRSGKQHLDPNEHINVMKWDLEAAVEMVMNGEIDSNSTAHLILKVERTMGV